MPIETTPAENGATSFKFSPNFAPFEIPACPDPNPHGLSRVLVNSTIDSLAAMVDQRTAIYEDAHLSGTGKDSKFDPIARNHNLSIARISDQVDMLEAAANRDESQMLAVAPIDPGHSVAAIEAREIRDWLARLPMEKAFEAIEHGGDQVLLAVKRSPIPMSDPLVKWANEVWNRNRRAAHPEKALQIDSDRATVEWARRGLGIVAGVSLAATGAKPAAVLRAILEEGLKGYAPFGFSKTDATAAEFRLKHDPTFKKKTG